MHLDRVSKCVGVGFHLDSVSRLEM